MGAAKQRTLVPAGSSAADFDLPALGGGRRKLAELLAKGPVVLAFFKITCPVCQFTFPFLERIHAARTDQELQFIGISQDDPESTAEFNRQFGVTFPTLLDTEESGYQTSNKYGISHVPTTVLIERDGTVGWALDGFSRSELEKLGARAGAKPFRKDDYVPEWRSG
jgi:peroxiredoxin